MPTPTDIPLIAIDSLPSGGALRTTDNLIASRSGKAYKVNWMGASSAVNLTSDVDITQGQALAIDGTGNIILAQADDASTCNLLGFAEAAYTAGESIGFAQGFAQGYTGLLIGEYYYLSVLTPGGITDVKPSTSGQYVVPCGVAISSTTIRIITGSPALIS